MRKITITIALLFASIAVADKPPKFQGDEVALRAVTAKVDEYLGGEHFTLVGGVTIDDFYNFGYRDAEKTHYSLDFAESGPNGKPTDQSAYLYLDRSDGKVVVDELLERSRYNQSHQYTTARVTCRIYASRTKPGYRNYFELIDIQFVDKDQKQWTKPIIAEHRAKLKREREIEEQKIASAFADQLAKQQQKQRDALPKFRTWTDASGNFTLRAKFSGVINDKVKLCKESGECIYVSMKAISQQDHDYIQQRKAR